MPIKTNFLKLEKLEGHENYNGDIENSNLDKIDATIKNHEDRTRTLEDKINKKDKLTVELKPEKKVVSVTDSFGGACGFEIEGALVENIFNKALEKDRNPHKYNYVLVEPSKPYVFKNPTDMQIDMYYGEEGILSEPVGSVPANGILKLTPTKSKISMYLLGGLGTTFSETMVVKGVDEPLSYFEGLQPLRGVTIEGLNKNLIDVKSAILNNPNVKMYNDGETVTLENTVQVGGSSNWVDIPINIEIGKSYYFQNNITQISGGAPWEISIIKSIEPYEAYTRSDGNFVATTNLAYLRLYQFRVGKITTKPVLKEGTIATTYEPHVLSKLVLDDPLAKLPNGTMDKIVRENGKTIKYVETNVGHDGGFYELKAEDFDALDTSQSSVDRIRVNKPVDSISYGITTQTPSGWCVIEGYDLSDIFDTDASSLAGYVTYKNFSNKMMFYFNKGKYSNTDEAKADLVGTKIAYQLTTPQIIDLSDKLEPLNSYEGYTQFNVSDGVIEGEKANLGKVFGGTYNINAVDPNGVSTPLKFRLRKFKRVYEKKDGVERDIMHLGGIANDLSYGNERWQVLESKFIENNIDPSKIYVDYTTSETNGQANVKITYNADLSSAVSSNASAVNVVGEQTDRNTEEIENITSIEEFQPIPLHGASVNTGDEHGIRVVNGYVEGFGALTVSGVSSGIVVLNTDGYTPIKSRSYRVCGNNMATTIDIQVRSDGDWKLYYTGDAPTYFYLDQIRFKVGD